MQIQGQVFVITGGASGLGAATARRLVAQGGKVVLADVNAVAGAALAAELGAAACFVLTDVCDEDSAQQAFAAALGQVQSSLLKDNPRVMLRIEPLEVRVLKAEESVRVEKFLFFFLPRQRREFRVQLEITVKVSSLDVDKVDFTRA